MTDPDRRPAFPPLTEQEAAEVAALGEADRAAVLEHLQRVGDLERRAAEVFAAISRDLGEHLEGLIASTDPVTQPHLREQLAGTIALGLITQEKLRSPGEVWSVQKFVDGAGPPA